METSPLLRALPAVARGLSLSWFVVHFALTVAYVSPLNPIRMRYYGLLNLTIGRFFPQNWSFFAPNPVASNQILLARCLTGVEAAEVLRGQVPTTGWYDLSSPFQRRYQQNRFSAYDRLARPQSNAVREYMAGNLGFLPWLEGCQKGSSEACKIYDEGLKASRARASIVLGKVGSAFCRDVSRARGCVSVMLRLRDSPVVPWSERFKGGATSQDMDLGVFAFDDRVVSTKLYRVEAP